MDHVLLDIPASLELLHVVRAVVSGVAASKGLSYDAIDAVCLTASEAAASLMAMAHDGQRLSLRLRAEDAITLTLLIESPPGADPDRPVPVAWDPLSWKILSAMTDDLAPVDEEGSHGIRIVLKGA